MVPREKSLSEIESAIDRIVESYASPTPINNLESAALPNRRAVIAAYNQIASLIYLGFYAEHSLTKENLRASVSNQTYPAYEGLKNQIARAVAYERQVHHEECFAESFAHDVTLALFQKLPELREMLNEDATCAFECDPAAKSVEEVIFSYPTLKAITAHRVAHVLYGLDVPMIPRILSEFSHSLTGIDIHPGARIGRRFFIDHGTGVVVGETTEIGDDVKLFQGVTLGALSSPRSKDVSGRKKRHPTIGDRVTIYAGATILGGDTVIGEDCVVGGNVWIVKSIPPHTKLFGRRREEAGEFES